MSKSDKPNESIEPIESKMKSVIVSLLHSLHDSTLEMMMNLEKLLKLFGEDMSWYENWRKRHTEQNIKIEDEEKHHKIKAKILMGLDKEHTEQKIKKSEQYE
ncbi:MAG: hypothetical protein WC934_06280 [Acidithiobacillus sp.]|jgi:hypothetical protein|uniref:hypothetical protein n=1 Tax=Acidithiobacillus sp. TaxID=1872118 RepID=UPI00355CC55F